MVCVQFEDARSFMVHVENLLQLRQQLTEKEKSSQEDVDERRRALQALEDQHHLRSLHMNVQLSQLHGEVDEMCSETLTWVPVEPLPSAITSDVGESVTFGYLFPNTGEQVEPHPGDRGKENPHAG